MNVLVAVIAAALGWHTATASAYDLPGNRQGCPGAPVLTSQAHTFASFAVPCNARVRFCLPRRHRRARCVVARRTDSGPFVAGRTFDLNLGTVRALGFASAWAWGVRRVYWRRER